MNGGAFRIFQRKSGVFYAEDTATRRQFSLKTRERSEADAQLLALSEARRNPSLNAKIGMLYLGGADPEFNTRTWQDVMNAYQERGGKEATIERAERAFTSWRFDDLRICVVTRTRAEDFLSIMNEKRSTASTHYLRRLHNFARDLGWLPVLVIADALWPKPKRRKKRAITEEEHLLIIEAEKNHEQRDYYEMLWLTGGSQTDIAMLVAENVNRKLMLLIYHRCKRRADDPPSRLRIGAKLKALLDRLPQQGPLFPTIRRGDCRYRSAEFRRRCKTVGVAGVSLHSYRYAWAQRAKEANYPERAAMNALGHASKAVHRAYAEGADAEIPSLEEYEMTPEAKAKII